MTSGPLITNPLSYLYRATQVALGQVGSMLTWTSVIFLVFKAKLGTFGLTTSVEILCPLQPMEESH